MAHTKSSGAAKYGRDSQPKYLGIKKHDGQPAKPGDILVRQRGTKILAGDGVRRGSDDTLYAIRRGVVKFSTRRKIRFDGHLRHAKAVSVVTAIMK